MKAKIIDFENKKYIITVRGNNDFIGIFTEDGNEVNGLTYEFIKQEYLKREQLSTLDLKDIQFQNYLIDYGLRIGYSIDYIRYDIVPLKFFNGDYYESSNLNSKINKNIVVCNANEDIVFKLQDMNRAVKNHKECIEQLLEDFNKYVENLEK